MLAAVGGGCMYIRVEDDDEECTKDCRLPGGGTLGAPAGPAFGPFMLCRYGRCATSTCGAEIGA